jgi:hypothetical protein
MKPVTYKTIEKKLFEAIDRQGLYLDYLEGKTKDSEKISLFTNCEIGMIHLRIAKSYDKLTEDQRNKLIFLLERIEKVHSIICKILSYRHKNK